MNYLLSLRYVKLFSYKSAKVLQEIMEETHKHRYTYYYGFQIIYGTINKALLILLLGLLLGVLKETIVITLSFALVRVYAGGLHYDSYTKCAYVSLGILIGLGALAKVIQYNNIISLSIFLMTLLIFLLFAPVENKNKPIKENKKIKFKHLAIINLCLLMIIHDWIPSLIIKQAIIFGMLLAGFVASPLINKVKK